MWENTAKQRERRWVIRTESNPPRILYAVTLLSSWRGGRWINQMYLLSQDTGSIQFETSGFAKTEVDSFWWVSDSAGQDEVINAFRTGMVDSARRKNSCNNCQSLEGVFRGRASGLQFWRMSWRASTLNMDHKLKCYCIRRRSPKRHAGSCMWCLVGQCVLFQCSTWGTRRTNHIAKNPFLRISRRWEGYSHRNNAEMVGVGHIEAFR